MQDAHDIASPGALVPLDRGRAGPTSVPRPLAAYVTQLIACASDVPAYRARRRAAPGEAAACYGAAPAVSAAGFERLL
ncbi:MAG TPA: hypothetical protein VGU45_03965 [Microvirga sp.]|nr:hypothetical protein [Microvirga sp.]